MKRRGSPGSRASRRAALVTLAVCVAACAPRTRVPDDGGGEVSGPAATAGVPPGATRLDVTTIDDLPSTSSGFEEPARQVIDAEPEWRTAWSRIATGRIPAPRAPEIGFQRRIVVLAAMGSRNTGGYTIEIEGAWAGADSLYVDVVERSPGADCLTTQALTSPVTAVAVERVTLPVRFIERRETRACP